MVITSEKTMIQKELIFFIEKLSDIDSCPLKDPSCREPLLKITIDWMDKFCQDQSVPFTKKENILILKDKPNRAVLLSIIDKNPVLVSLVSDDNDLIAKAITYDPKAIRMATNPTDDMILLAVSKSPYLMEDVPDHRQTYALLESALNNDYYVWNFIKNKTPELHDLMARIREEKEVDFLSRI